MPFPGIYPPPDPCLAHAAAVTAELTGALDAYGAAPPDLARFYGAASRAEIALVCLDEALPTAAIAQLYVVEAILAYAQKDPESAAALLRGARALGGALPTPIAENNPRLVELDRTSPQDSSRVALSVPQGVSLLVDGAAATEVPSDRPYLVQLQDTTGAVVYTGVLARGARPALDRYAPPPPTVAQPITASPCPEPTMVVGPPRPRPAIALGALGTTVLSASLYGLAATARIQLHDPDTPESDFDGLASRANAAQWAALGVGVVAIGLDVTAAIQILQGDQR